MALKRPKGPAGTLVVLEHTSKILKDNPLGDPHVRKLAVWLPPQYDEGAGRRRFPVLYDLVGFTGSGLSHTNWKPFGDNVPERAARLIREQKMGPAIFVFPDCFTALGGNQYVNSSAIGNYADYLTREIIPFVDREFRTLASREHRGCFGKSSGGYGSIIHGMKYAKYWGAIADHSGDAYFDFVYWHDWPNTLNELAKHRVPKRKPGAYDARGESSRKGLAEGLDDGRIKRFLAQVWKKEKLTTAEGHCIMNLCMAATYDPDPESAARLSRAVQPRIGRGHREALEQVARARPDQPRREIPGQPQVAARHLHRLRLARPVSHPLRHAHPVEAARRGRHPPHLRGIRRRPLRRRLPDGREPAVPLQGVEALRGCRKTPALRWAEKKKGGLSRGWGKRRGGQKRKKRGKKTTYKTT